MGMVGHCVLHCFSDTGIQCLPAYLVAAGWCTSPTSTATHSRGLKICLELNGARCSRSKGGSVSYCPNSLFPCSPIALLTVKAVATANDSLFLGSFSCSKDLQQGYANRNGILENATSGSICSDRSAARNPTPKTSGEIGNVNPIAIQALRRVDLISRRALALRLMVSRSFRAKSTRP